MCTVKPDADEIQVFLRTQAEEDWIKRSERRVWPQFLFHYTDITNAVYVLRTGYLYSRQHLEEHDMLPVSAGSSAVLAGTRAQYRDCVRLYFRPRTPTQFYAEGIHSRRSLEMSVFPDAHCPVPVFFLFDAASILARADCQFSDGGLNNSQARVLSTAVDLRNLPWKRIYHTGPHSRTQETDIPFRRNAEAIVPRKLDLAALRYIYCRSDAERETYLNLIDSDLRDRYGRQIVASTRSDLFYRRRSFVVTARLTSDRVWFQFSPETQSPGPFQLVVDIIAEPDNYRYADEDYCLDGPAILALSLPRTCREYTIRVCLDEHLAYQNSYQETVIPF